MNKILQAVLKVGETIAVQAVPGAAIIDGAVRGIVEHKGDVDSNALDAAEGAIKAVEAISGTDIADEIQFRAGCATVDAGVRMIAGSLKHTA